MKVTSEGVKTALLVGAVIGVGYVAWRAIGLGASVKDSISESIGNIGDKIGETFTDAQSAVMRAVDGARDYFGSIGQGDAPAYPEAGPIRAAQSAAESAAIQIRYADPDMTFEQAQGDPYSWYGLKPAGFGVDSVIGSEPQTASPSPMMNMDEPIILVTGDLR